MPVDSPREILEAARIEVGLSRAELWLGYFELGGMSSALEVEAYVLGALAPSTYEYNLLAHARNERHVELGANHRVGYADNDGLRPKGLG